jgi:cell division protein FtsQ
MRFLTRADRDPPPVRARRRRRFQRRATYGAAAFLALATLAGSGWYAARNGVIARALAPVQARVALEARKLDLTVQSVEVVGRQRTAPQAVLNALGVRRGTPILEVDLAAAKTRLESLPWVRSAAVERLLPDTIFVRLVEHQPLAVWQDHGRFAVIDQAGDIIPEARAGDFAGLPQVVGTGAASAAPEFVEMIASEPDLARHVAAAVRVGDRRWNVDLDDGIEIALPETDPGAAWHRLATLDRNERLLERQISEVDMRLPNRLVLRLPHDTAKAIIKKPPPARPNA